MFVIKSLARFRFYGKKALSCVERCERTRLFECHHVCLNRAKGIWAWLRLLEAEKAESSRPF
jgi:hypothetical protein